MVNTPKKNRSNQSLECVRMIAALFVVFAHVPFPGRFGEAMDTLARFSVPFFFAVTGYFSYGVSREKLEKRLWHIVVLNIAAIAACVLWNCLLAAAQGETILPHLRKIIPTAKGLAGWIFFHVNPHSGHLWYLTAIAFCTAVLWAYTAFRDSDVPDYRPLYWMGAVLFAIRFAIADLMRLMDFGIPYFLCRDGLFYGMPMLCLGLFLREHRERILRVFRFNTPRLAALLIFGILLSLLQLRAYGVAELPLGALVQVFALILLAVEHPNACGRSAAAAKVVSSFGFLSASVYILHLIVSEAYSMLLQSPLRAALGNAEGWLRPLLVAALSILLSLLIRSLLAAARRLKSAHR